MNLLVGLLAALVDTVVLAKCRVECIRRGHQFLCIVDGHLCRRCGRTWCDFD